MYTAVTSVDERHQFTCHDGKMAILLRIRRDRWKIHELAIRVNSRLMAITNCGRYVAFADEDEHTLYVCSFDPAFGLRELAVIQDFPVHSYSGLEWIEPVPNIPSVPSVMHLQGLFPDRSRTRHEEVWRDAFTAVA